MSEPPVNSRQIPPALACAAALVLLLVLNSCQRSNENGAPAKLIQKGWDQFRLNEPDVAERCFTSALSQLEKATPRNTPAGDIQRLKINATYGLALVWSLGRHGEDPAKSVHYFQQVLALDPKGDMAPWAALGLVRNAHLPVRSDDPIDIEALKKSYAQVIATYPGTPAAAEAFLYRMTLFLQTLTPKDAQVAVDEITPALADNGPLARYRGALYELMANAFVILHDYPKALNASIKSLENRELNPANPTQNNIVEYYRIGLMAEYDVGDFPTARKFYQKLLSEYPTDQKCFVVKAELQRMDTIEAAGGDVAAAPPLGLRPLSAAAQNPERN